MVVFHTLFHDCLSAGPGYHAAGPGYHAAGPGYLAALGGFSETPLSFAAWYGVPTTMPVCSIIL